MADEPIARVEIESCGLLELGGIARVIVWLAREGKMLLHIFSGVSGPNAFWAAGTADKQSVKSGPGPAKRNKWRGPRAYRGGCRPFMPDSLYS